MPKKLTYEYVKDFINIKSDSGCTLISEEYVYAGSKLIIKCFCGNEFSTSFAKYQNGKQQCNECGNRKSADALKLSYEEVKKFIEIESGSGCLLLSEEYINSDSHIELKCKCGNIFTSTFSKFKGRNKRQCNACSYKKLGETKKLSYEDIKKYIEIDSKSGCTLISKEYEYNNPSTKLEIQCKCKNKFITTYNYFYNMKYKECFECTNTKYNKTVRRVSKVSKEEFQKRLDEKFNGEFVVIKYNMISDYVTILHKKCGNLWTSIGTNIIKWKGDGCPLCTNRFNFTTEIYKEKVYEFVGDEYTVLGEYKNIGTPIKTRHNFCGYEWNVFPVHFLHKKSRCPACAGFIKTNDDFTQEVYNLVGNHYTIIDGYINAKTKIRFKHNDCGNIFSMTPLNFLHGQRCPSCSFSKGEKQIEEFLKNNNVNYIPQHTFRNCININPLKFDFAVLNNNNELKFLIEYDGEQHFEPIEFFGGQVQFEYIQQNDGIKNKYCFDNNIPLFRIPYWESDNLANIMEDILTFNIA